MAEPRTWAEYRKAELDARLAWLQRRLDEYGGDAQAAIRAGAVPGAIHRLVAHYGLRRSPKRPGRRANP